MWVDDIERGGLQVMAVAWWREDQWDHLREVSEDRDRLEESFEEWESTAQIMLADVRDQVKGKGIRVVPCLVDIDEMLAWCNEQDMAVNAESRAAYVGRMHEQLQQLEI